MIRVVVGYPDVREWRIDRIDLYLLYTLRWNEGKINNSPVDIGVVYFSLLLRFDGSKFTQEPGLLGFTSIRTR